MLLLQRSNHTVGTFCSAAQAPNFCTASRSLVADPAYGAAPGHMYCFLGAVWAK